MCLLFNDIHELVSFSGVFAERKEDRERSRHIFRREKRRKIVTGRECTKNYYTVKSIKFRKITFVLLPIIFFSYNVKKLEYNFGSLYIIKVKIIIKLPHKMNFLDFYPDELNVYASFSLCLNVDYEPAQWTLICVRRKT